MTAKDIFRPGPCEGYAEDLVLLHCGALRGAERDGVLSHVHNCAGCAGYAETLRRALPLAIEDEAPGRKFWRNYSRELRLKLDAAVGEKPRAPGAAAAFRAPFLPVAATAAIVVIALALTFGRGLWPNPQAGAGDDSVMLEALPSAENLEFLRSMDLLDNLDLLEAIGAENRGA